MSDAVAFNQDDTTNTLSEQAQQPLAALPFDVHDHQQAYLPLAWLTVQDGFNPRTFFDDAEHRSLVASIAKQGVIQALIVRPVEGFDLHNPKFWVIAGERRYRAARKAACGSVPVIIRMVDERRALTLAELENNEQLRKDLSIAEEARFAQRFIGECDGDKDEAANLLGWSRSKLEARVLLLNATPSVLDALCERKIKVGHAELLAGLPSETQQGTLTKILSDKITVADLKARIKGYSLDLGVVIFDKTDCVGCPHNSATQGSLFAEAIDSGRCQNHACFKAKIDAALAMKKAQLQTEYPVVFFNTERAPDSFTILSKGGDQGVGDEQFSACQQCQNYAAMINTQAGREGQVQAPVCVNVKCHKEKVVLAHPKDAATKTESSGATTLKPNKTTSTKKTKPSAETPKKVEVWIDDWIREQAANAVNQNQPLQRTVLLYALYLDAGKPSDILKSTGIDDVRIYDRAALITALAGLEVDKLNELGAALISHLIGKRPDTGYATPAQGEMVKAAVATLQVASTDITATFVPNAAYWKTHTKASIEAQLRKAKAPDGTTFADWYQAQHAESETDTKAFERLIKGKHDEIVDVLTKAEFDWSAWLPDVIAKRFA